jgi:hypothetical protein
MCRGGIAFVLSSFVSAVMLLGAGCGGSDGDGKTMGAEGGPCTAGGTCDTGLTCLSKVCVNSAGGGGTSDAGGISGGGDPCAVTSALCERLNACSPITIQILFGDLKTCTERQKLACNDALKAPGSGLTQSALNACAQALASASCEQAIDENVPACQTTGERANGESCGTDEQCKSGYCSNANAQCGVCSDRLKAGVTCVADKDCQSGMVCNEASKCAIPSAGGTACSETQPCQTGYYCRAGSCAANISQAGGTCDDLGSCDIIQGLFCNPTVGRCQSLKMAAAGSTCGLKSGEFILCSAGNCELTGTDGICSALAKDGESCGVAAGGTECMMPAKCIAGRCKLPSSAACL